MQMSLGCDITDYYYDFYFYVKVEFAQNIDYLNSEIHTNKSYRRH